MAYHKRRFRSRGRFTRVRTRRGGFKRFARTIKRVVRRMSEVKYTTGIYATSFDGLITNFGSVIPAIPLGNTKNSRIGNRVRYKYFQFRMILRTNEGSFIGNSATIVRVILFQPRIAVPTVVDPDFMNMLFTNKKTASGGSNINQIVSPVENQNVRIIMDKTFPLGISPNAARSQLPTIKVLKKKVRINNNVNFGAGTEVFPRDPKDTYWLLIITDATAGGDVLLTSTVSTRVSFVDVKFIIIISNLSLRDVYPEDNEAILLEARFNVKKLD